MKKDLATPALLVFIALILTATFFRVMNVSLGWFNLAPIAAMSLFCGAVFSKKIYAFAIPLVAYLLSDLYIHFFTPYPGFYDISQFFVYGGMLLVVLWGTLLKELKPLRVLGFTLGGTAIFWIVSNFGVFLTGMWGTGLSGLTTTYLMALPFYTPMGTQLFFNAFISDIVMSAILFGAYVVLMQRAAVKAAA